MYSADYEKPTIQEIGHVHELTLQDKDFGFSDGLTFQGASIANASVV